MFAEAVRLEPNNVQAYVLKATAHAERQEFEKMDETLDRLARRAPRHPGVHHYIGDAYARLKLPDRALACYDRAARLPGAGPPTWIELASLYERAHRLEEAEDLLDRAARVGFTSPTIGLIRGRIERRQKRFEAAESTLRTLIDRLPADAEAACEAWGELALMKDTQGDYQAAVSAIERCKRGQRTRQAATMADSDRICAEMRTALATMTRADLERWQTAIAGVVSRPVALLTGFPRSGTTLLEQALDAHPGLVSSEERDFIGWAFVRELRAGRPALPFRELLDALTADEILVSRERSFRFMDYLLGEPSAGRLHLDKNPGYNLIIPAALRLFPEMKLIVALRDPRDVLLSCYLRYLPLNAVSVNFLDVARTAERYALDMAAWLKYRDLISTPWC
jgi:tetratricopeptide (TPR) repeat protein